MRIADDQPGRPGEGDADDPRLEAAVREYVAGLEAGRPVNRRELLARYPEVAAELADCLSGLAFLRAGAAGIRSGATAGPARAAVNLEADADLANARPLGDFRLVREIGRGGMGVVYEAVQLSLGRRVAVKVLSMAAAIDARQLQRFHNEAHAAAQLHHTNIVPVYAVGCERSVHFYAMQLIEGRSLGELIAEMRGAGAADGAKGKASAMPLAGITSRSYDVDAVTASALPTLRAGRRTPYYRTVARLGVQAAEALDHAHRAGVVHRDVKPANLLLDDAGTLWVTDFGLALLQHDHGLTQAGETVGTLQYMSPEQASGRAVVLDQRTDIYSLGVTLYEMLTLERAFPGGTREQLLYQIQHHDPRPPRSIDPGVPPELQTILAAAMAKDPAERYPTARALADDLNRFLRDEPIRARRPSLGSRAFKWARRHRALVAAAAVVTVTAAVGFSASTVLIAREQAKTQAAYDREREKVVEANRERALAEKSSARAERSFAQARDAVNFLSRVAAEDLADAPQVGAVRKEMLEAALDYHQAFLEERASDPAVGEQLAEAEANVASILAELAAFEDLDRVQSRVRLLSEPSVRAALGITDEQAARVQPLAVSLPGRVREAFARAMSEEAADAGGKGRGPWGITSSQRRDVLSALAGEADAELGEILTHAQAERLMQVSRQVRGLAAFGDPDVLTALGLTRDQRDMVRRTQAEARRTQRDAQRRGPGQRDRRPEAFAGSPAERARESRRAAVEQVVAKLTPAQAKAWQTLAGEPFAGNLLADQPWHVNMAGRAPPQPGRGGPGQPGGPDGRGPDGRGRGPGDQPGPQQPGGDRRGDRPRNDRPRE